MDAKVVANYFAKLKEKNGFTIEVWAEKSNASVSTLKNLLSGKTEDPRLATVTPYIYAAGGSVDEMLNPNFNKNETRPQCEKHIAELKESHAREIALKDEIIKIKDSHANLFKLLTCIGFGILIVLLILEVTNPNLGWIQF